MNKYELFLPTGTILVHADTVITDGPITKFFIKGEVVAQASATIAFAKIPEREG